MAIPDRFHMRPVLLAVVFILVAGLALVATRWPPAAYAFVVVLPLAALTLENIFHGHVSARSFFYLVAIFMVVSILALCLFVPEAAYGFIVVVPLIVLGIVDMRQKSQSIRRNFPVIGHFRYLLEAIRPEIQQYFIESNTGGTPFARESRSLVYRRAKGVRDTMPFGTQRDVYEVGYEWINHSLAPVDCPESLPRVLIGEAGAGRPYSASLFNISAMSFGALSSRAVEALNRGARTGGFAHNTGEGGLSPHHLAGGGDVIWQIGTGYFGCRAADGGFDADRFRERAADDAVKMIEIKLSQGAKPGHGGILPAAKITKEIAAIRDVPLGRDVISPPSHRAFHTPTGLLEFVARLRELSGGKPVGFKLCIGRRREFLAICKAILETGCHPDYIAIDGAEGGTGAAPAEFSNSVGCPLTEGLIFAHNALVGIDMREKIRIFASGKIVSGFDLVRALALGADACYSARAMMMAIGCIQARRCNDNECPVGVATQNPSLVRGLVVEEKAARVARYHAETLASAMEIISAAGLTGPGELRPWHVHRRIDPARTLHYGEIYEYLEPGALLRDPRPEHFDRAWRAATAGTFAHA